MKIKTYAFAFFLCTGFMLTQSSMVLAEELPAIAEDEVLQENIVDNNDNMDDEEDLITESIEAVSEDDVETSIDLLTPEDYLEDNLQEDAEFVDIVFNEDELAQWISNHKYIGGTVRLGAMVTIADDLRVYADEATPITIDTGEFGLVYDGAYIYGSLNYLQVRGEGVDVPVVDAIAALQYKTYLSSWNHDLMQMNITANGRDGLGGTALRVRAVDENAIDAAALRLQGTIRAYGEGAVGLWLDVPIAAYGYRIEVYGDNSTAVYALNGAELYYCKLTADGNGASAVSGSEVLVDTCAVSPEPQGMQVIHRQIEEDALSRFYVPLKQNAEPDSDLLYTLNMPGFFLSGSNGGEGSTRYFNVVWDVDSFLSIDTSILGETKITATVDDVYMGLGLFDDIPITMTVEVRDPDLPCISEVSIREKYDDIKLHAYLFFWDNYDLQDKNVILWRSDDYGETWWNAKNSSDIEWYGDWVDFSFEELLSPVWFQLEIVGVGESNIIIISEKNGVTYGGAGGDRTGTDRNGAGTESGGEATEQDNGGETNDNEALNTNTNAEDNEESLYDGNGNAGDTLSQLTDDDSHPESKDQQDIANEQGQDIDESLYYDYIDADADANLSDEAEIFNQDKVESPQEAGEQLIEMGILPESNVTLAVDDATVQFKEQPFQSDVTVTDSYDSQQPEELIIAGLASQQSEVQLDDAQLQSKQTLEAEDQEEQILAIGEQADEPLIDNAQSSISNTIPTYDSNQISPAPADTDGTMIALLCAAAALTASLLALRLRRLRR